MDELQEQGTEIFSHHGVILRNPNNREDDSCLNGTLSIVQYSFGKCIEWKPTEVSEVLDCPEQDWSLVTTVGHRSRTLSSNSGQPEASCSSSPRHKPRRVLPGLNVKVLNAPIVQSMPKFMMTKKTKQKKRHFRKEFKVPRNEGQQRNQPVRIELRDLKSYRVKKHGRYLTLMQRDGTSHTFHFHYGSIECFVNALRGILRTRRSGRDRNLYIVLEEHMESQSLNKSFAELNLFPENPTDVVWKFVSNLKHRPYETTMETFSKLTDVLLYRVPDQRPVDEVADLLNRSLSASDHDPLNVEEDYQMIPALPPRPEVKRGAPLTAVEWSAALDEEGRVIDAEGIKQIIFRGGVTPSLRHMIWKFLLGYFPWNSTLEERQELRKSKVDEYFRMKLQWRSMSPDQEERFADYRDRKSLIEKDVNRTDRTLPFFEGDNNTNLALLQDILMTYVMYNFDLGYVQGMSDLLSPILILMSNEVDAFWCFVGLMERVCTNFDIDQAGMKKQLSQLHSLLSAAEPELALYLDQHDSANMFFCFRWLLVLFKREFTHDDIMGLWEVIFTDIPCPNFHLLLCVAILDCEKNILIENRYGFTEILKHINDLSLKIDVDKILRRAESIYLQLYATPDLQINVKRIIGLAPPVSREGSSDEDEDEEVSEHTDPDCERVNFVKDTGEVAFERSINLNYH